METEKSHKGQKDGKYTFQIRSDANKKNVKDAIEKYYGVKVKSVKIIKIQPKTRSVGRGRTITKRKQGKKVIVTTVGAKPIEPNKIKV